MKEGNKCPKCSNGKLGISMFDNKLYCDNCMEEIKWKQIK